MSEHDMPALFLGADREEWVARLSQGECPICGKGSLKARTESDEHRERANDNLDEAMRRQATADHYRKALEKIAYPVSPTPFRPELVGIARAALEVKCDPSVLNGDDDGDESQRGAWVVALAREKNEAIRERDEARAEADHYREALEDIAAGRTGDGGWTPWRMSSEIARRTLEGDL